MIGPTAGGVNSRPQINIKAPRKQESVFEASHSTLSTKVKGTAEVTSRRPRTSHISRKPVAKKEASTGSGNCFNMSNALSRAIGKPVGVGVGPPVHFDPSLFYENLQGI